jgi:hypothetical protein
LDFVDPEDDLGPVWDRQDEDFKMLREKADLIAITKPTIVSFGHCSGKGGANVSLPGRD